LDKQERIEILPHALGAPRTLDFSSGVIGAKRITLRSKLEEAVDRNLELRATNLELSLLNRKHSSIKPGFS